LDLRSRGDEGAEIGADDDDDDDDEEGGMFVNE
jgi:hypothetical protein